VTAVRFAARGRRLLSAGGDKRLVVRSCTPARDRAPGAPALAVHAAETTAVSSGTVYDLAVDPTGRLALSAGHNRSLCVWDAGTGARKRRYEGGAEATLRVRVDPSGMFFATSAPDKAVRVPPPPVLGGHAASLTPY